MATYRNRKCVIYLHHRRDHDGDVLFYFLDVQDGDDAKVMQSSPIERIRRSYSAVIDPEGCGNLARYIISTQNTDYQVQMPVQRAAHLAGLLAAIAPGLNQRSTT